MTVRKSVSIFDAIVPLVVLLILLTSFFSAPVSGKSDTIGGTDVTKEELVTRHVSQMVDSVLVEYLVLIVLELSEADIGGDKTSQQNVESRDGYGKLKGSVDSASPDKIPDVETVQDSGVFSGLVDSFLNLSPQ